MGNCKFAWIAVFAFLQANAQESGFTQPDPQTVVYNYNYSLSKNLSNNFRKNLSKHSAAPLHSLDTTLKAPQVLDWQQAQQQLQHSLELAKEYNSARYAGFGIQLYKQLDEAFRQHPDVQLAYADLLQYTHQFEQAVAVLTQLQTQKVVGVQANLRLYALHLMQGRVEEAQQACRALGRARTVLMSTICSLWLDGLRHSSEQSISRLAGLIGVLPADDSLENWAREALIDLYVHSGDTTNAMRVFASYEQQNSADAAMGKLIVDALLFKGEFEQAAGLLEILPETEPFIIRRAIVETKTHLGKSSDHLLQAQQLIDFYKITEDPNHYYDIALWYWLKVNEPSTAWQFAAWNWERFKYIQDFQLMQQLAPLVDEKVPASAFAISGMVGLL